MTNTATPTAAAPIRTAATSAALTTATPTTAAPITAAPITAAPRTGVLRVPGAELHHEIRGQGPLIALVGAPMDARPFAALADLLAVDHTVLTADPRGIFRSGVDDREQMSTPELRADDLARLLQHLDAGPAVVLGSSGGAVTALALTQARPELVSTVIAHEAPLEELLEDRAELHARTEAMVMRYLDGDVVGGWEQFFTDAGIEVPPGMVAQMFGGERDPQVVADEHYWFAREMQASTWWRPDLPVLRSSPVRVVLGVGEESSGQACDRASRALGALIDADPVLFPGDHTGFTADPAAFAARLRDVLGGR